jgi:anaerobic ribonucleoside-triphosphate reductase
MCKRTLEELGLMDSPCEVKKEVFFGWVEKYLEQSREVLIAHKELLKERINSGFLQFFNCKWVNINQFFCTFGYTGLWDAYKILFPDKNPKDDIQHYIQVAGDILDFMDNYAKISGKLNEGYAFNLEEIPGENACPKLAEIDNYYYRDIEDYVPLSLLSNQMVPLYEEMPLFDRIEVAGALMNKVSGGSMFHFNISDDMTPQCNEDFNRMLIEEYDIPHYAINRGSTTCVNGHTHVGIHWKCPECDGEIYTHTIRIIGYEADTVDFTDARNEEFKKRIFYSSEDILNR